MLFVAGAISLVFDALPHILPGIEIPVLPVRVVFLIGLLAMGYGYRRQVKSNREEMQRELARARHEIARTAIQNILELALRSVEAQDGVGDYRANIMLVENSKLVIRFHYRMDDAPDLNVQFEKNQGCAGQSWGSGGQRCADLRQAQKEGGPSWNLTSAQEAVTSHLGAVLSTPIFNPQNHQDILGVFNIDSQHSLQETCFLRETVSDMTIDFASMFAAWLTDVTPIREEQAE
jgi:hypothetical protein